VTSTSDSTARVVSASTEIAAPPATVFAILADPRQHQRIDGSGSLRGALRGPDKLSKGAGFGMDMKLFGLPYKIRNTVVEYVEPQLIAWRHFGGHRWRYLLEATPTGTRVTEQFDYSRYQLPQRLFIEALRFPARNREGIEKTLVKLKAAAESDAATTGRTA
jgi:uncharacterized protein YndB with AHSA1/START domain